MAIHSPSTLGIIIIKKWQQIDEEKFEEERLWRKVGKRTHKEKREEAANKEKKMGL